MRIASIILSIIISFIQLSTVANNDIVHSMELHRRSANVISDTVDVKKRISTIDSLIAHSKNLNDTHKEVKMLKEKGDICRENGLYATALTIYDKALKVIDQDKSKNPELRQIKINILLDLGRLCYFTGKYELGISHMYELLKINDKENEFHQVSAYSLLGTLFLMINKPDTAQKYLRQASKLLEITNPKDSIVMNHKYTIYNCLASIHSMNKTYDSSIYYLQRARNNCNNDINKMNIIYQNTAALYTEMDEWGMAEEYFSKALNIENRPYERVVIMNNLSLLYLKQKEYDKSFSLCKKALELADKINATVIKSSLLHIISELYAIRGDYKMAFEYRTMEQSINDTIYSNELNEKMLLLNNDFELYEIENDKKLLEYQVEVAELANFKKGIIITLFSILFIIVIVALFFIMRGFIRQRKYNKALETTIDRFDEEKQEIIHQSKEKFETEISNKARELTANAMFIAKMCDVANHVTEEIKRLKKQCNTPTTEPIFDDIENSLNSLMIEEKGWEEFKVYFEQVHQSFFPNLNAAHPDLTPGENRMCAFVIMNLTTKEIAQLTNRSIRTVDTIKFRIRRKLNIHADVSTFSYLKQFI